MLPFFPEDDPVKDGVIDFVLFSIFVGFLGTTILASYEALPVSSLCLHSPVFFSPVVLCLPSDAARRFF